MHVTVNGKNIELSDKSSVISLLKMQNIEPAAVAVEINCNIVQRVDFDKTELMPGDVIEILRFVGGG
jgi:sulfur carrier protein